MPSCLPVRNRTIPTAIRRLSYRCRTRQRPGRYSRNHRIRRFILPILTPLALGHGGVWTIVFDGQAPPGMASSPECLAVLHTGHGRRDGADDRIVELVRALPDRATSLVYTSDAELRDRVHALGAQVAGARALLNARPRRSVARQGKMPLDALSTPQMAPKVATAQTQSYRPAAPPTQRVASHCDEWGREALGVNLATRHTRERTRRPAADIGSLARGDP